ncbi:siderophore-interacting protein [Actinomycetota bacterium]|nr:siderophore-interacting protein [Actinomycetota bacterium]
MPTPEGPADGLVAAASSARRRPAPVRSTVLRTSRLSPSLVRVVLGGPGMVPFEAPVHTDSYVKLVFLPAVAPTDLPLLPDGRVDLDAVRTALPADAQPRQRAYTVRAFDPGSRELTVDLVVHGDEGVAGPWALAARPGDELLVLGPGGGYSPDPAADWHLLAGDASTLPAVAAALERLAEQVPDARGHAVLEVHDAADELTLVAPAGITLHWVHQGSGVAGLALVDTVLGLDWADGRVHAFVHGEAGAVRELRRYLRVERAVPRADLSISGYWRLGADDEGWRAGKRDWAREIEESEARAGLG